MGVDTRRIYGINATEVNDKMAIVYINTKTGERIPFDAFNVADVNTQNIMKRWREHGCCMVLVKHETEERDISV